MYTSKEKAERAYKGYLGKKYSKAVFGVLRKIEKVSPRIAVRISAFLERQANKEILLVS